MKINFIKIILKKITGFIFLVIITPCLLLYLPCEMYNFQAAQKFSGNHLYNPYNSSDSSWLKSNFHAHSVAWAGITNGNQLPQDIINAYKQKGYDYASVSNYEKIADEDEQAGSIKVYEHGWNISKIHHLAISPDKVCYEDLPFYQWASSKQYIINSLNKNAKAIALPHPCLKNGYTDKDLKQLSGYNLMEVLNHSCNSSKKWDVALSAGKPVWIIGDDDVHDIRKTHEIFTNWTMVNSNKPGKDAFVENLINGNAYAVNGSNAVNDNKLRGVEVNGMNLKVRLGNIADSIKLIGQNGIIRETALHTNTIAYTFLDTDTYIRAVVYNNKSTMYLNPIVRYDGKVIPQNISTTTVNIFYTLIYRFSIVTVWAMLLIIIFGKSITEILKRINSRLAKRKEKSLSYEMD